MYEDIIKIISVDDEINTRDGITSLTYDAYGNIYRLHSPTTPPSSGIAHDIETKYTDRFPFTSGTHIY